MKKIILLAFLFIIIIPAARAQRKEIDSLNAAISKAPDDTNKVKALFKLAADYTYFKPDSGITTAQRAYALAVAIKFLPYQRRSLVLLANLYVGVGNYIKGMQLYYDVLRQAEDRHDEYQIIQTYNNMGSTYNYMPDYPKALHFLNLAKRELAAYFANHKNPQQKFYLIDVYILNNLDEAFLYTDKLDSAEYYIKAGMKYEKQHHIADLTSVFWGDLGTLEGKRGNTALALKYFNIAEEIQLKQRDLTNLDMVYFAVANLYKRNHKPDSAIFYGQKALASAREGNFLPDAAEAAKLLYGLYDDRHNIPLAYKYYKMATRINDSLTNKDKIRELASLDFEEKQHQQELAAARLAYQNTVRSYVLIGGLLVMLLLAFIFWRNGRQRKKANLILQEQKEEIETTLEQLKATQTQLVQSEKMASLGELTAGIAHEIQNPLNFVNNFSEVNREMLEELKAESLKPKAERDEQAETELIDGLIENEQKINHHGKRADAIVKSMLEHSRASTGLKSATNLNKLADEYLRLAYHGLRAKDKSFNAGMITHFDENLPKANIIAQDIGRVLLNLYNNAFYAVNQKAKTAGPDYKPTVEVSTSQADGQVIISVKDNGPGIPEAIKDKIMQPFFTTKPTGEGTGLGLSLSYDIIVKGHGGNITIETEAGVYTEFKVTLSIG